uniref:YgaP family membrane protein n=1 Tax=Bradyrhizobium sp. (strain ORS 278) TaxID=114615 RepID=UPI000A2F2EEE|nr:DUF2892 domain-containing protein [Bradyrhizobium sp. ORS 278]
MRTVLGVSTAIVALDALSGPGAWLLAAAGLGFAVTGAVGHCPACATHLDLPSGASRLTVGTNITTASIRPAVTWL